MTFVLIIIGVLLILFNIQFLDEKKTKPKPKVIPIDNKNSFKKIFEDEEMDTSAVDVIIGELRVEFSETILDLQKEIIELSQKIDKMNTEIHEPQHNKPQYIDELVEDIPMNKMEQIGLLLKDGHTVDELCEKFQMGRGEVLLIEKLYRK